MLIHVVRHAHAGSRKNWAGPDEDRPLSPRGLRQAQLVADALRDHPIDTLWSSPYLRC
ncbi:MAG: phosphoglycerate mutase family protein, partial [Aquihabitans sp.]